MEKPALMMKHSILVLVLPTKERRKSSQCSKISKIFRSCQQSLGYIVQFITRSISSEQTSHSCIQRQALAFIFHSLWLMRFSSSLSEQVPNLESTIYQLLLTLFYILHPYLCCRDEGICRWGILIPLSLFSQRWDFLSNVSHLGGCEGKIGHTECHALALLLKVVDTCQEFLQGACQHWLAAFLVEKRRRNLQSVNMFASFRKEIMQNVNKVEPSLHNSRQKLLKKFLSVIPQSNNWSFSLWPVRLQYLVFFKTRLQALIHVEALRQNAHCF